MNQDLKPIQIQKYMLVQLLRFNLYLYPNMILGYWLLTIIAESKFNTSNQSNFKVSVNIKAYNGHT